MEEEFRTSQQSEQSQDPQQLTKKERKELRRQERTDEHRIMMRQRSVKRFSIWLVALLIVGGSIYGLTKLGGGRSQVDDSLDAVVSEGDWSKGLDGASVTLVEYGDFQCPACGSYHPLLKQLEGEFGDRVQFIYRHFPLKRIHPFAGLAARASEAAGIQGKFWEMHDLLFENQSIWSRGNAEDAFLSYAQELELDISEFEIYLDSDEADDAVEADFDGGVKSGVNSTPSFFVNGQKIVNPGSYEDFSNVLSNALDQAQVELPLDDNS
jgi:protein-disulfide isomerase